MKPEEVLDTTLDVFNALVKGYNDRIIDFQALTAQIGYWSAYYQSKRPKKLDTIVSQILKNKLTKSSEPTITTESDIKKFQERELRRISTYNRWEKKNG